MALMFSSRSQPSMVVFLVICLLWFPHDSMHQEVPEDSKLKRQLVANMDLVHNWQHETQAKFESFEQELIEWENAAAELQEYFLEVDRRISALADKASQRLYSVEDKVVDIEEQIPRVTSTTFATTTPAHLFETTVQEWWPIWWQTLEPPEKLEEEEGIALDVMRNETATGVFSMNDPIVLDAINLDSKDAYNISTGSFVIPHNAQYLIYLQMDSSDDLPSTFRLVGEHEWFGQEVLLELTTGRDPVNSFTLAFMFQDEVLRIYPADEMDGITSNVKPGFSSRLCLFSVFSWG